MISTYRHQIPQLMAQQHVPGLSVALVDRDRTLWVQGFGRRDDSGDPVTAHTVFSAESMSKLFTATAVMQAVAAGRLDLDAPVSTYLPGFTVNSAFEQHPERSLTLRMLLSHTAGLTHEAPVGNNYELDPGTFDAHVRSISQTWLRFPPGTGYAYSNLGIDLAGYVLEHVQGQPFATAMQTSLLSPLGMDDSTFDRSRITASDNRASGHVSPYPSPPIVAPMTAAGGLYTSAADLARFLRFQLDDGTIDGHTVLGARWMRQMRTIPAPDAGAQAGYALGVARTRWNRFAERPVLFDHGGGGFGFISDLWWAAQLGVGVAILTNSQDHHLAVDLPISILTDLVTRPGVYHDRLSALPFQPPVVEPNPLFQPPSDLARLVARAAMPGDGHQETRWESLAGRYRRPAWDVISPLGRADSFSVERGVPSFDFRDDDGVMHHHRLVEVRPRVFLADDGETLDLRGSTPRWAGMRLVRVSGGPNPWQWVLLAAAGVVAAAWLVHGTLQSVRRRGRSRRGADSATTPTPGLARTLFAVLGALTAIVILATVVSIVVLPGLVDSGYLGWLDLPLALRLAFHLPLALAVLTGCTVLAGVISWLRGGLRSRADRVQLTALAVAGALVSLQLAAWNLIA